MHIPLWLLVFVAILLAGNFAPELVGLVRRLRHHDHLIAGHPRSARVSG